MSSRTNKIWILKKKQQLQKQKLKKQEIEYMNFEEREFKNPLWNIYKRFYRSWKWINLTTKVREDPDWYRIIRKPNSWEIYRIYKWITWWLKRYIRKKWKSNTK